MQSETPKIALDIINKEKEEKSGVLNLNNCGLTDWPEEIFEMPWLEVLIIGRYHKWHNKYKIFLFHKIGGQIQLNNLTKISEKISALTNLKALCLDNNQISKIENLDQFTKLKILNLSHNQIEKIENLDNNCNLQTLSLFDNKIKTVENISKIPLRCLDIRFNQIEVSLVDELAHHPYLNLLYIGENPIKDMEGTIFNNGGNCLPALRSWYNECNESLQNKFYKICLIGDGRVGKSSLLDRLERNSFNPEKDSSHGIIIDYSTNWTDNEGNPATIQYWDFGGQDLYHGTHKWFLKGDHLNLLVWNKNKEEDKNTKHKAYDLEYWLGICERCNSQNKVLISQTKKEIDGLGIPEEFEVLKNRYNLINNIIHIDSAPDDPAISNIDTLKTAIQNQISISPLLSQKIPLSYHKVRSKIIEKSKKEIEIDIEEFREICQQCGVGKFYDFDESCKLCLRWLQITGVVFHNEHILSSRIIIDQKWAIDAVYKAFDPSSKLHKTIIYNKGRFLLSDLVSELEPYSEHEQNKVLDYLQSSYTIFEIGYNYYKKPEERTFICPRFLPEIDVKEISELLSITSGRTILKLDSYYDSDFDDMISILGQKGLLNTEYLYKNSVVLEDLSEKILLYKGENGKPELKGHNKFEGLFKTFSKIPTDLGLHFSYNSKNGIIVTREFEPKEVADQTIKIFISYAHAYQEASNLFINKLKNFLSSSSNYEIKIWADHDIFLGEDWNNRIQTEIKRSDLSILLLSDDFFNSKYIRNIEMNVFIDQQRKSGYPFIPIYFSPCEYKDWEAIKRSQLFKPDANEFEEVNSKDFAFTSLLYKGPTFVDGAENSPNVNYYFKMLRRKLEEVFMNIKK